MAAYGTVYNDQPLTSTSVTGASKTGIGPVQSLGGSATEGAIAQGSRSGYNRDSSSVDSHMTSSVYSVNTEPMTYSLPATSYPDTLGDVVEADSPRRSHVSATSTSEDLDTTEQYDLYSMRFIITSQQSIEGYTPGGSITTGAIVPTAYFRKVRGKVLDENGDPITVGLYLVALDNFAVAGRVEQDGTYEMYLLKQEYKNFILVADAGENDAENNQYDFVWYESEGNPNIGVTDDGADLVFNTAEPNNKPPAGSARGLSLGSDIRLG